MTENHSPLVSLKIQRKGKEELLSQTKLTLNKEISRLEKAIVDVENEIAAMDAAIAALEAAGLK